LAFLAPLLDLELSLLLVMMLRIPNIGFMVHQRGIEISRRSIDAINKIVAPTNKTELQSLIGMINFIRRFISNLSGKIHAFSPLLKLKAD